jgi:hypothetical protein
MQMDISFCARCLGEERAQEAIRRISTYVHELGLEPAVTREKKTITMTWGARHGDPSGSMPRRIMRRLTRIMRELTEEML